MQDVLNLEVASYALDAVTGWLHAHPAIAAGAAAVAALALVALCRRRAAKPAGT